MKLLQRNLKTEADLEFYRNGPTINLKKKFIDIVSSQPNWLSEHSHNTLKTLFPVLTKNCAPQSIF